MEIRTNRIEFGPDLAPDCTLSAHQLIICGKSSLDTDSVASATVHCTEDCPMDGLFIKEKLPWMGKNAIETIDLAKGALRHVIGGCPMAPQPDET